MSTNTKQLSTGEAAEHPVVGYVHVDRGAQDRSPVARLRAALHTSDQLKDLPELEPLVEGWIDRETLNSVLGPSGAGKSLVAIALGLSTAAGRPWFGQATRQGSVLYIAAEGRSSLLAREKAWRDHEGITGPLPIHWLTIPVNLMDPAWIQALIVVAAELRPSLIVIDTFARCMTGGDENSTADVTKVVEALDRLKLATGACIVIVHHAGWEGTRQRGSSALRAALDTEVTVTRDERYVTLTATKQRSREDGQKLTLLREGAVLVPDQFTPLANRPLRSSELQALRALKDGPLSFSEWRTLSGIAERTLARYRSVSGVLQMRGFVAQTEDNRYELTETGHAVVD